MGNLTGVFDGKKFRQPKKPVTDQIKDKMSDYGLDVPDVIHIDGQLHRFKNNSKGKAGKGDKPGWYIFYPSTITSGAFGCWRSDINVNFREDIGRTLSIKEEAEHARRIKEAKDLSKQKEERIEKVSTGTAELIWDGALGACPEHPYLKRKGIEPCGARVTTDGRLIVPMYDENFELQSLQYIGQDGEKRFHVGAKAAGAHYRIGATEESQHIFISEGFATAATIHEVTQSASIVAYSASNIPCIAKLFKEKFPDHKITVVADNDPSGVGKKYAEIAVKDHGVSYVMPQSPGMDANDYEQAGKDLRLLLMRDEYELTLKCKSADFLKNDLTSIRWLIRNYVPRDQLMMVHGPSASGKSYVVLDWALRIATGCDKFLEHKVRPGKVFYMAGEGHHGIKARIQAWAKENDYSGNLSNMLITSKSCQLESVSGFEQTVNTLKYHKFEPDLIVIDTVNRFFGGDENSSQQVSEFIRACENLQNEYKATVLLVHHTGVSDEAQHRPRGSSAWRASLDGEISVVKKDGKIKLINRKDKEGCGDIKDDYLAFKRVGLGREDEDGVEVASSVLIATEAEPEVKKETKEEKKLNKFKKIIMDFCIDKADYIDGEYVINKAALAHYLVETGVAGSEATANRMCKPAGEGIVEVLLKSYLLGKKRPGVYKLNCTETIRNVDNLRGLVK